jgi:hypothetical protein
MSGALAKVAPRAATGVTIHVPFTFRRRGGRRQVVTPDGAPAWARVPARVDSTLVKALARAHRWQRMLESDAYDSLAELADAEKINPSYLARVLRLTLLAPDIVEAIANAQYERVATLDHLLRPFPIEWSAQRLSLQA